MQKAPTIEGRTALLGKLAGLDKNVSKSEIKEFISFMDANALKTPLINAGDTWANPMGDSLSIFVYMNRAKSLGNDVLIQDIQNLADEYNNMAFYSDISLDEFKERYINFKKRYENFVLRLEKEEVDKNKHYESDIAYNPNPSTQERKPFTPIQAQSKNKETYISRDDINKSFFLRFIENERKKGNDVLEFLTKLFSKIDKNKVDIEA